MTIFQKLERKREQNLLKLWLGTFFYGNILAFILLWFTAPAENGANAAQFTLVLSLVFGFIISYIILNVPFTKKGG